MRAAGLVVLAALATGQVLAQRPGQTLTPSKRKPAPTPAAAASPTPAPSPTPREEPAPAEAPETLPAAEPLSVPPPVEAPRRGPGLKIAAAPTPGPLERSVSASKQFVIYQSNGTVRGKVARRVEDVKTEWLRALRIADEWKSPIVVQLASLAPPGMPRMRTGVFLSDGAEMKVQIDVFDQSALRGGDFDREVYRALLLELMYRRKPPKEGKPFQQPPVWLLEAFVEDARARAGEGIAAGLYDKIIESGPPPKLDVFLKERPEMMDATTRAIYRARSMALLRAFLTMPEGSTGLAAWIMSLPESNPADAGKLVANFPSVAAEPASLSKQWALSLADASASDRMKALSMDETLRLLTLILDIGAPMDPKKPNENMVSGPMSLPVIARTKGGKFIMNQKAEELLRLQIRAHPLLRPIVEEYHLIATELAARPKKNLEKRLTQNAELQKALSERAGSIADYMNWFEAAKLETPSREFDVLLEMPSDPSTGRSDPITRHMNDLEARGW